MSILQRKSKKKQIEKVSVPVVNDDVSFPEKEYRKAVGLRRTVTVIGLIALIVIEGAIAGGVRAVILKNDLKNRSAWEYEIRHSGQIRRKSGVYEGETDFGYFVGKGNFDFYTGETYSGTWKDNVYNGSGTLRVPSEGTYSGDFSGAKKEGTGTFTWEDGAIYVGVWKNDQMYGKGKYTDPKGLVFDGTFENNAFRAGTCSFENSTGKYKLIYKNCNIREAQITYSDGTTYIGQADASDINGTGKMDFPNKDQYSGKYADGKRSGSGKYTWAGGDSYDGEWSEDEMSGKGKYTFSNGSILEGTFKDNSFSSGKYQVKNDFGTYEFTITAGEAKYVKIILADGTTCDGEINDNHLTGTAQIKYSNGDTYDGSLINGEKSGQGKYTWKSGATYDGSWENDQMSGTGTYMYPTNENGYKLVGSFSGGVPNGECTYYSDKSTSYKTTWSNGNCTKVTE